MKITLLRALLLPLLVLTTQLVTNCAPERAKAIREDKSLTLGLPGASYRPNGKVGVGATFSSSNMKSRVTPEASTSTTLIDANANMERTVQTHETSISPFVQIFPWETSAFFVGVGGSYHMSKVSYDENRNDSTSAVPTYTNVSYQRNSTWVGAPVGWAWIWQSGFSLTLDFGPRIRVSQSTAFNNDGSGDRVDQVQRDNTVKAINKNEGVLSLGGSGIIGWSF